jgi:ABC-type transport system involved in multi-copper enzyme maturation permease subunit
MSLVTSCTVLARRALAWSSDRRAWAQRLVGVALLAGAAKLVWAGARLPPLAQLLLAAALVFGAAVLFRRGWVKLFGPVLFYDMVRSARRGRYILLRCCYAGLLLLTLFWVFTNTRTYGQPSTQEMARLAETYFESVMAVQLLLVLLLTPVYVAGAIADEKERRTLEYLLATDLRGREIVLGKLAARLANLGVLVLTGLPVLSAVQFLGGVDPNLVLTGFAATALTMLGLGGLSIVQSTYSRRPRDAIALTYLALVTYYVLSFFLLAVLRPGAGLLAWTIWPGHEPWTVGDLLEAFHAGNLLYLLPQVVTAGMNGTLATTLPRLLREYAVFQGVLCGVCCGWALLRFRAVAVQQMEGEARRRGRLVLFRRLRIGVAPMMWKELWAEGGTHFGWGTRLLILLLVVATFFPAASIVYRYLFAKHSWGASPFVVGYWEGFTAEMNTWVRTAGTLVACLTLLWVAVRASTCVSRERDRQTLDGLLSSPLDSDEILLAKCVGNVLSVRRLWLWLGAVWALGVWTGALHPVALVLVLVAWLIYAAFLSILGSWFSVVSRTSLRATVCTLLTTAAVSVGHWLIWMCCGPLLFIGRGDGRFLEFVLKFQAGLTPPVVLFAMQFPAPAFEGWLGFGRLHQELMPYCLVGLILWAAATLYLWVAAGNRFRVVTNRHQAGGGGDSVMAPRLPQPAPQTQPLSRPPPATAWGAVLIEESWDAATDPGATQADAEDKGGPRS